ALADFVRRLVLANAWVNAHPDQFITDYYVKTLKQTPAAGRLIYQGTGSSTYIAVDAKVRANQQQQADLWARNGLLPSNVDISAQFNQSVLDQFNKAVE
ncbi:MAG TPA: hypothetical protein VH333_14810, partial [Pseudonocardiaceae bacterium]|nr:hypothetical protein [Pseudonocardiaceae bacterium]